MEWSLQNLLRFCLGSSPALRFDFPYGVNIQNCLTHTAFILPTSYAPSQILFVRRPSALRGMAAKANGSITGPSGRRRLLRTRAPTKTRTIGGTSAGRLLGRRHRRPVLLRPTPTRSKRRARTNPQRWGPKRSRGSVRPRHLVRPRWLRCGHRCWRAVGGPWSRSAAQYWPTPMGARAL
jgi:hypothetical protein